MAKIYRNSQTWLRISPGAHLACSRVVNNKNLKKQPSCLCLPSRTTYRIQLPLKERYFLLSGPVFRFKLSVVALVLARLNHRGNDRYTKIEVYKQNIQQHTLNLRLRADC